MRIELNRMDFRILHLEAMHWLWLVAAVGGVLLWGAIRRRRALRRFATAGLQGWLTGQVSQARRRWRVVLLITAMLLLVAALIDPRWGVTYRQVQQRSTDILILLDVSKSMLAEDVQPNRLGRAKQYIRDLVDQLGGDRIGLITFAGAPSVQCPLTIDYGAFLLSLDLADTQDTPREGSLLGDALRLAGDTFTDDVPQYKAVILFSDGEDHGSYPMDAAQRLHDKLNVPIITVGIGDSDEGARIPVEVAGQRTYLTYHNQEVWTRMDPKLLREMALATDGIFIPAGTGYADMEAIYSQRIEGLARRELDAISATYHHPQYQWFAGAALLLLMLDTVIGTKRSLPPRQVMEQP